MNDTPDNASQSFDAASYVALKLAEDTALAIFTDGITDQKAEAAFKLIDIVAPKDKIDIAIFIANYAGKQTSPDHGASKGFRYSGGSSGRSASGRSEKNV
jgi:hypothetical protein